MATDPKNELHRKKWLNAHGRCAGMGFQMPLITIAGAALSRGLDSRLRFDPTLMALLGVLAGLSAAIYVRIQTTCKA